MSEELNDTIRRRASDTDRDIAMEALFRVNAHEKDCAQYRKETRDAIDALRDRFDSGTRTLLIGIIAVLLSVCGVLAMNVLHLHG